MTERQAVWVLALCQMLGYACFFYIFAALILYWQEAEPWSDAVLAAGPMVAVVVSAALAPFVGRTVDRGGAVLLMTLGPGVGALGLGGLAVAQGPVAYVAAWVALGAAQAMCLYEVCFGLLIRRHGVAARGEITKVTLVAGLASTLAFPAGAALAEAFGWRAAVWLAVGVALGVMLPLQYLAARVVARAVPGAVRDRPRMTVPWREIVTAAGFARLAVIFALVNLNHWMLMSYLRPMLDDAGMADRLAVMAAATIGPAQVAGRLVLMAMGARADSRRALMATVWAFVLAPLCLMVVGHLPAMAFGFAILQGAAMGTFTILRPVMVAETLGQERYGATAGLMAIPGLIASAVAPMAGAGLIALGGGGLLTGVALGLAVAAMLVSARSSGVQDMHG